jgi:hypothetical protein
MIKIQRMPDIWDDTTFWTSRCAIIGELANWAARQSPYLVPDGLEDALREFNFAFVSDSEEYFETNCKELNKRIRDAFDDCPKILGWNNPKRGNSDYVFSSRYGSPQPDYDFIGLDALARNIAHSITLSEKYHKIHD